MLRPLSLTQILPLSLILGFSSAVALPAQGSVRAADTGISVTEVALGKQIGADKLVTAEIRDFGARDTIYVAVKTHGAGSARLGVKWTYEDEVLINESSQDIAPTGDATHEFHISKASAWPKGGYRVVISINGDSVRTKDFRVK